jgi:hypothetical protein
MRGDEVLTFIRFIKWIFEEADKHSGLIFLDEVEAFSGLSESRFSREKKVELLIHLSGMYWQVFVCLLC